MTRSSSAIGSVRLRGARPATTRQIRMRRSEQPTRSNKSRSGSAIGMLMAIGYQQKKNGSTRAVRVQSGGSVAGIIPPSYTITPYSAPAQQGAARSFYLTGGDYSTCTATSGSYAGISRNLVMLRANSRRYGIRASYVGDGFKGLKTSVLRTLGSHSHPLIACTSSV